MSLRVYVYPGDLWGCGSYRLRFPGEAVAASGDHKVSVVAPGDRQLELHVKDGRVIKEGFPEDADVVVLQRVTTTLLAQVVPMLRSRGVAVVVDMDDDLSRVHPTNPAFMRLQPTIVGPRGERLKPMNSWKYAAEACRDATLVTVTTPALVDRYGSHGRVRVLPNMVPERYLLVGHEDSDVIGWAGAVASHPHDLQTVGPAIARLTQQGARFFHVGDGGGVGRALGLREDPPSTDTVPFEEWPLRLAELGIGIAPLADTQFNRAKSRLKPLEYAAVGVPWVGSGMPDYRAFHELGCGMLADRPKVWGGVLRRLIREPALRADLSAAGREVAAVNTYEGNAWRWAEVWAEAARLQREAPTPVAV